MPPAVHEVISPAVLAVLRDAGKPLTVSEVHAALPAEGRSAKDTVRAAARLLVARGEATETKVIRPRVGATTRPRSRWSTQQVTAFEAARKDP